MIKHLVKKIRRQPKGVRDNIALGIAATFTAFIFVIWLYHLPVRNAALVENKQDESSSFSQLLGGVSDQVSAIKEAVKDKSDPEEEKEDGAAVQDSEMNTTSVSQNVNEPILILSSSTVADIAKKSEQVKPVSTSSEEQENPPRVVRIVTSQESSSSSSSTAQNQ